MKVKLKFIPLKYKNKEIIIIDQTKLPHKIVYKKLKNYKQLGNSIKKLEIRGAPLLGIAPAFGILLAIEKFQTNNFNLFYNYFKKVANYLKSTRPTAVNLFHSIERIEKIILENKNKSIKEIKLLIKKEAEKIFNEDLEISYKIGEYGSELIKDGDVILTHCNAGGLATSGLGTALACMFIAKLKNKKFEVIATETRPLWQGARLTTWELLKWNIPVTLICDNTASYVMKLKKVNLVITGADRIAKNGDTANKIGTYNLALAAYYHKIPFYIAAPSTTFDLKIENGSQIPIEYRNSKEITMPFGKKIFPDNVKTLNPAFDVTPSKLISGFITEKGILYKPFKKSFKKLL